MKDDSNFWRRIQKSLALWTNLLKTPISRRDAKNRKATFFVDQDFYHKRVELHRELFYNPKTNPPKACFSFGISMPTYYRLVADYKLYGLWAIIPALSGGKQSLCSEQEFPIKETIKAHIYLVT